jgi:hypothetical protein
VTVLSEGFGVGVDLLSSCDNIVSFSFPLVICLLDFVVGDVLVPGVMVVRPLEASPYGPACVQGMG